MQVVKLNEADTFMTEGVEQAKRLLDEHGKDSVAVIAIVIDKSGTSGYHFSHQSRLARLAMIGGIDEVKDRIMRYWDEIESAD